MKINHHVCVGEVVDTEAECVDVLPVLTVTTQMTTMRKNPTRSGILTPASTAPRVTVSRTRRRTATDSATRGRRTPRAGRPSDEAGEDTVAGAADSGVAEGVVAGTEETVRDSTNRDRKDPDSTRTTRRDRHGMGSRRRRTTTGDSSWRSRRETDTIRDRTGRTGRDSEEAGAARGESTAGDAEDTTGDVGPVVVVVGLIDLQEETFRDTEAVTGMLPIIHYVGYSGFVYTFFKLLSVGLDVSRPLGL